MAVPLQTGFMSGRRVLHRDDAEMGKPEVRGGRVRLLMAWFPEPCWRGRSDQGGAGDAQGKAGPQFQLPEVYGSYCYHLLMALLCARPSRAWWGCPFTPMEAAWGDVCTFPVPQGRKPRRGAAERLLPSHSLGRAELACGSGPGPLGSAHRDRYSGGCWCPGSSASHLLLPPGLRL